MDNRTKALIAGIAISGAAVAGGVGIASASGGNEDNHPDQAISGRALDDASAAALAEIGEGTVTGTEVGDEDSYYEVEVTKDDGSQVDVQLDRSFHVVDVMADHEEAGSAD
ncbi:MAG TPA: hypothetical protein VIT24_00985 [Acidimicrobiales bacterium]